MKIVDLFSEDISFAEYVMLRLITDVEAETNSPEVWESDIVRRVRITPQAVSKFIRLAIKKGYLERFENTSDRRAKGVRMTGRGRDVLNQTDEELTLFYTDVLSEFSEEEKATMHGLMNKLHKSIQENYLQHKKR